MRRKFFILCVVFVVITVPCFAQATIDQRGHVVASEDGIEANKRMAELLKKPTFFSLRLVSVPVDPSQVSSDSPLSYCVGDRIEFELIISHAFLESLLIWQSLNPYQDLRPKLFRDGDLLPYSTEAQESIDRTEREPPIGGGGPNWLLPGKEYSAGRLILKDWYGPLAVGHYDLSVRRRSFGGAIGPSRHR